MLILKLLYKNPTKLSARKIEIIQTIISDNYSINNYLDNFRNLLELEFPTCDQNAFKSMNLHLCMKLLL